MSCRRPIKDRVINPCRFCKQTVAPKSGLQCNGACQVWAHYRCLGFTTQKILDIRNGVITVNCPCPNCHSKDEVVRKLKIDDVSGAIPTEIRTENVILSETIIDAPIKPQPLPATIEEPSVAKSQSPTDVSKKSTDPAKLHIKTSQSSSEISAKLTDRLQTPPAVYAELSINRSQSPIDIPAKLSSEELQLPSEAPIERPAKRFQSLSEPLTKKSRSLSSSERPAQPSKKCCRAPSKTANSPTKSIRSPSPLELPAKPPTVRSRTPSKTSVKPSAERSRSPSPSNAPEIPPTVRSQAPSVTTSTEVSLSYPADNTNKSKSSFYGPSSRISRLFSTNKQEGTSKCMTPRSVKTVETCTVQKSKSFACLTVLKESRIRSARSDATMTSPCQPLLWSAVDQLCNTVGQLSCQIKLLMIKLNDNYIKN